MKIDLFIFNFKMRNQLEYHISVCLFLLPVEYFSLFELTYQLFNIISMVTLVNNTSSIVMSMTEISWMPLTT